METPQAIFRVYKVKDLSTKQQKYVVSSSRPHTLIHEIANKLGKKDSQIKVQTICMGSEKDMKDALKNLSIPKKEDKKDV